MNLKLVILESPYKAPTDFEILTNVVYARVCARDCFVNHHEAPFLSHLLYTQEGILKDDVEAERQLGINAGLTWGKFAEATVVYIDRGISPGMRYGIENAKHLGRPVFYRALLPQKYYLINLTGSVELLDFTRNGHKTVFEPGLYAMYQITNPFGKQHSRWLVIAGTNFGATHEYIRGNSSSITALS